MFTSIACHMAVKVALKDGLYRNTKLFIECAYKDQPQRVDLAGDKRASPGTQRWTFQRREWPPCWYKSSTPPCWSASPSPPWWCMQAHRCPKLETWCPGLDFNFNFNGYPIWFSRLVIIFPYLAFWSCPCLVYHHWTTHQMWFRDERSVHVVCCSPGSSDRVCLQEHWH